MKTIKYIMAMIMAFSIQANAQNAPTEPKATEPKATDASDVVVLSLKDGDVQIELYADKAPAHVTRFLELVKKGFYNGAPFHRVIDGFMAQTGDPSGTGTGKSDLPDLNIEYNDIKHVRGVVSMARGAELNSANSQFFICLADAPHLDRQYTAFGRVIKGMEFVDKIKKGDVAKNGKVENPDKIIKMTVLKEMKR